MNKTHELFLQMCFQFVLIANEQSQVVAYQPSPILKMEQHIKIKYRISYQNRAIAKQNAPRCVDKQQPNEQHHQSIQQTGYHHSISEIEKINETEYPNQARLDDMM